MSWRMLCKGRNTLDGQCTTKLKTRMVCSAIPDPLVWLWLCVLCLPEIIDDLSDKVGRTTARIERETRHVEKIRVKASDKGMTTGFLLVFLSVCLSACLPACLLVSYNLSDVSIFFLGLCCFVTLLFLLIVILMIIPKH